MLRFLKKKYLNKDHNAPITSRNQTKGFPKNPQEYIVPEMQEKNK
jgi:hypothetical protein